jgi:hypothetical protein
MDYDEAHEFFRQAGSRFDSVDTEWISEVPSIKASGALCGSSVLSWAWLSTGIDSRLAVISGAFNSWVVTDREPVMCPYLVRTTSSQHRHDSLVDISPGGLLSFYCT